MKHASAYFQLVLDNDQQEIVKTLYHRCMSNVPSLSVIEGLSGKQ